MTDIIGIEFRYKKYDSTIAKLFYNIDEFRGCYFDIDQAEIIYEDCAESVDWGWYEYNDFIKLFENRNFLATHFKIAVYPNESDIRPLTSYMDYVNSKCLALYLLVDCEYIEIYAKEDRILKLLINNARSISSDTSIKYKTEAKDNRISFII